MLPTEYQPYYFKIAEDDGTIIAQFVPSELTDDENLEVLGREMFALVDQYSCPKIVLDMAGVSYMTSSVLGKIITLHRKQQRSGGRLVLCNLESGVVETLETSRLHTYFTTAEDVPAALSLLN